MVSFPTLGRARRAESAPELPEELRALRDECLDTLRRQARWVALASATPIPGVDLAADVALLTRLLPDIARRFRVSETELRQLDPRVAAVAWRVLRSMGPTVLGKAVTYALVLPLARGIGVKLGVRQAAKYVPLLGNATAAAVGYATFMLLGRRHIEQCIRVRLAIDGVGAIHDVADASEAARG